MTQLRLLGNLLFQLGARLASIVMESLDAEHYATPRPSERTHMYTDSDSEDDSYPPVSSTGTLGLRLCCLTVRGRGYM